MDITLGHFAVEGQHRIASAAHLLVLILSNLFHLGISSWGDE